MRVPRIQAQSQLSTDIRTSRAPNAAAFTAPARALQQAGGQIAGLGNKIQGMLDRQAEIDDNLFVSRESADFNKWYAENRPQWEANTAEGAEGYTQEVEARLTERQQQAIERAPTQEAAAKLELRFQQGNAAKVGTAATFQAGSKLVQRSAEWDRTIQGHMETVFLDPSQYDELLKRAEGDFAAATQWMDAAAESEQKTIFREKLKAAHAQGRINQGDISVLSDLTGKNPTAKGLIQREEGFRSGAYWDVNAYRVGYGHDIVVRENGKIEKVTANTAVSQADADRTLNYIINEREGKTARKQVGDAWRGLPKNVQAALYSVAYNYGSLPDSVASAARGGDIEAIASAIGGLDANKARRAREAALARGSATDIYTGMDIGTRQGLTTKARTEFNRIHATSVSNEYDDFNRRIVADPMNLGEDEIFNSSVLDGTQQATLVRSLRAAQKDIRDSMQDMADFQAGRTYNPFETKDRKSADNVFEQISKDAAVSDQQAAEFVTRETGIAPRPAVKDIRAGLASRNTAEFTAAIQQAQRLQATSDTAFSGTDGASGIEDAIDKFQHYTSYLSANEAAQKMLDLSDPEKRRESDRLLKENKKEIEIRTQESDVLASLDAESTLGFGGAEIGFSNSQKSAVVAEYREIYEGALIEAQGDHDLAQDLTDKRFKNIYGEISIDGDRRIMRLPPEKDPRTQQLTNALGSSAWIGEQLKGEVDDHFGRDVPIEHIRVWPDERTEQDRTSGGSWSYQVYVFNPETLEMEQAHGRWVADPSKAAADFVSETRAENEIRVEQARKQQQTIIEEEEIFEAGERALQRALDRGETPAQAARAKLLAEENLRIERATQKQRKRRPKPRQSIGSDPDIGADDFFPTVP